MPPGSKRKRLHEGQDPRHEQGVLGNGYPRIFDGLNMARDSLSDEDRLKLVEFLSCPSTPEGRTRRYRSLLLTLASIGDDISQGSDLVDGGINPQCPTLIREAANMSPFFKPRTTTRVESTQQSTSDVENSDDLEEASTDLSLRPRKARARKQVLNLVEASQTLPQPRKSRTSGTPLRLGPEKEISSWRPTWERVTTMAFGSSDPPWLADVTALLEQITSTICLTKIVSLADEIYESRIVFHLYRNTNTEDQLRASADAARDVALKFKELWSKHQSDVLKEWAELYRYLELGRALMKLMVEMADENTQIGKAFLESRPRGSRRKTTEAAMNTFMIAHLLKIMDYTGEQATMEQARRKLKRQRMTAMNTLLFVEAFGEGVLLQLLGTRWSAILPQVSYRSMAKPVLTLALEHPEFRINARLAEMNIADFTKDKARISQLPRQAIMAQSIDSKKYPSYSMAELLSRPGADPQTINELHIPESSPLAKRWMLEFESSGEDDGSQTRPDDLPRVQELNGIEIGDEDPCLG